MTKLDAKFIVNLKGKDFVTYDGLMELAHQIGLKSITTELIQIPSKDNGEMAIVKATVIDENDRMFEGYGDACPKSVTGMVVNHKLRMAETRAKARALRDLTNVGMTAFEELGGDDNEEVRQPKVSNAKSSGISDKQIARLYAIAGSKKIDANTVKSQVNSRFKKAVEELTRVEYDKVCKGYESMEV